MGTSLGGLQSQLLEDLHKRLKTRLDMEDAERFCRLLNEGMRWYLGGMSASLTSDLSDAETSDTQLQALLVIPKLHSRFSVIQRTWGFYLPHQLPY